jgi:hypothetical protein
MSGLYSLRDADRSVKLAAVLFMLVLGYAYVFAFLMVKQYIMIYAIIAALQTLLILGLGWRAWWRDLVIACAFGSGALDFAGQWLMKAGIGGFAWLTLASGWLMTAVYLVVLFGTLRAVFGKKEVRGAA